MSDPSIVDRNGLDETGMEIVVLNRQRARLVSTPSLVVFATSLSRAVPPRLADSMTVCLVSDRTMSGLNFRFRGKKCTTDVLSFPSGAGRDPDGRRHLGDILISVPLAARQAREAGHSLGRELRILLLHGYLHLLGYDHEVDGGTMMRLQRRIEARLLRRTRGGGN